MKRTVGYLGVIAALAGTVFLTGCPATSSGLFVYPTAINFGETRTSETLTISNGGGVTAWTASVAYTEGAGWLSVDPAGGSATVNATTVHLRATRTGLSTGVYHATVTISAGAETHQIRVAMSVPGSAQLIVSPTTLNYTGGRSTGSFTIRNDGDWAASWALWMRDPANPGTLLHLPAFLEASPASGTVAAGQSREVTVTIDREQLEDGVTQRTLVVSSSAGNTDITLNVGSGMEPAIGVEPQVLDFQTSTSPLTFEVYNAGSAGTELTFSVRTDRPEFVLLTYEGNSSRAAADPEDTPRVPVSVSLNRREMNGSVDSAKVFVEADGLDPVEVLILAEAAPLSFEGALNRTRPPFIMRFVFLLRDALGEAVDPSDPALEDAFTIYEDEVPLDMNETSVFVTDGSDLRYNVVLLLDYTGSMYQRMALAHPDQADALQQFYEGDPSDPNDRGAAGSFVHRLLESLPETCRVALMEHHDRQQTDYTIRAFTSNEAELLEALDLFSMEPAEHGATAVYDAVSFAIDRLVAEDINVLPFDDTDVRAVVFLTDGMDTSSVERAQEVVTKAKDNRVRLYPVHYGGSLAGSTLLDMARETGGSYYAASTESDLVRLLDQRYVGGVLERGEIVNDLASQIVLTYVTLFQEGSHTYQIFAEYDGDVGSVNMDAVFATGGDVRAGQLSLQSAGISNETAEVYLRAEYVPRNVSQFQIRLIVPVGLFAPALELVPNGWLDGWTLVPRGMQASDDGLYNLYTYSILTTPGEALPYGAFGNLLRMTFSNVNAAEFDFGFRVDNRIYLDGPFTRFFQHPEVLTVTEDPTQASVLPLLLEDGFDPEAPGAWDRDTDGTADFDDVYPDDPLLQ